MMSISLLFKNVQVPDSENSRHKVIPHIGDFNYDKNRGRGRD